MNTKTEAERLADTLDVEIFVTMEDLKQAAAELRRLKSDNDDLKAEILEQCRINGMGADREDALRAEVERLKKADQQAQPTGCTWVRPDSDHMPDTWQASCGAAWTFTEGGPKDNDMHFCPKCGKPAIESANKENT